MRHSQRPERLDRKINQRRTDRTLFHRQQRMGTKAVVADGKLGFATRDGHKFHARTVAVIQWRGGMCRDLRQRNLGYALHRLTEDLRLVPKLRLVGAVLVMAP